jgi:hypothetical protein
MDIVKFKITFKTIKIEVHQYKYVFDFIKAVENGERRSGYIVEAVQRFEDLLF